LQLKEEEEARRSRMNELKDEAHERDKSEERMTKRAQEEQHRANKAYRAEVESEMKKGNRTIKTTPSKARKQDSSRARALVHVNDEMEKGNRPIAWTSSGARKQDCSRVKTVEAFIEKWKGGWPNDWTTSEEERALKDDETRKGNQRPIALSSCGEWKQACSRAMMSMEVATSETIMSCDGRLRNLIGSMDRQWETIQ